MAAIPSQPRPTTTPPSRRRVAPAIDLEEQAPFLTWEQLYSYLKQNFGQGDHVAVIGPTGTGKTHIALEVAELRSYVLVVACKPRDPLIDDARKRGYYLIPGNKLEVPYVDGVPHHKRVIYWPRLSDQQRRKLQPHQILSAEKTMQRPAVGGAIGYVRQNGSWCLVLDEGTWVCRDLNLQRDVDSALFQFRTLNASVVILGQRPSWMGRYVLNSPTHLFLFHTADTNDRKSLGEISGVDTKVVQEIVGRLDRPRHECLYLDTRNHRMFRTIAPPR